MLHDLSARDPHLHPYPHLITHQYAQISQADYSGGGESLPTGEGIQSHLPVLIWAFEDGLEYPLSPFPLRGTEKGKVRESPGGCVGQGRANQAREHQEKSGSKGGI